MGWGDTRLTRLRPAVRACVGGAAGVLLGALLLLLLGKSPLAALRVAIDTVWLSPTGFADTVLQTTPLLLIALGYLMAYQARIWAVGGEGQFHLGAVATASVALGLSSAVPRALALPLALAAGVIAGALWAAVPGWLRAYHQVNEVVTTLMSNFVGILVMLWLIRTTLRDPDIPLLQTPAFPSAFRLPAIGGGRLHLGIVLALAVVPLVAYVAQRSHFGHWTRAIGANPQASRAAGVRVERTVFILVLLSGALAGLAGAVQVLGVTHRLVVGVSHDFGYAAIPVAVLARGQAVAVVPTAFLFGALTVSAEAIQVDLGIPSDFIAVFTGVLVLCALAAEKILEPPGRG